MTFHSGGGFNYAINKQKIKALQILMESVIHLGPVTAHNDIFNLLVEVIMLTKDINKKTRNSAYELIGLLAANALETNTFPALIDLLSQASNSEQSALRSAAIQAIARCIWETKETSFAPSMPLGTVLAVLMDDEKEVVKAAFLLLRVYLFIYPVDESICAAVLNAIFKMNSNAKAEFKVKIRNLLKSLIIKVGFNTVANLVPEEDRKLISYVNKFLVNKMLKDNYEAEVYQDSALDMTISDFNNDLNRDEEEQFIDNEFKKVIKKGHKDEELKIIKNLTGLDLDAALKEEKQEKKKELFGVFDDDLDKLESHLYVNNYAKEKVKQKVKQEEIDGVRFNEKTGKIVVKDIKLGKKRRHDDSDDEDVPVRKNKKGPKGKSYHNVKFSGSEYKSKGGQGDRLIKGKLEPFAYIQFNTKAALKRSRETPKEFVDIMKRTAKKGI